MDFICDTINSTTYSRLDHKRKMHYIKRDAIEAAAPYTFVLFFSVGSSAVSCKQNHYSFLEINNFLFFIFCSENFNPGCYDHIYQSIESSNYFFLSYSIVIHPLRLHICTYTREERKKPLSAFISMFQ